MFPAAIAGFLTSSLPVFNGRLLFQWLQFVGVDASESGKVAQYSVYLAVSAFAALCSCLAAYPLMVAQTRLNADLGATPQQRAFLSMGDVFSRLHKLDNNSSPIKTFYKGFSAFYLTGQIHMQSSLLMNRLVVSKLRGKDKRTIYSCLAGVQVMATALAYPFEVAYRLQIMAIGQL